MPYAHFMRRPAGAALVLMLVLFLPTCRSNDGAGSPAAGFGTPSRVHTESSGVLLVSDYRKRAVYRYRTGNASLHEFITTSSPPLAVASTDARVYVGNESTQSIEVYDRHGKYLGVLGGASGIVKSPSDIAVDPALSQLFVADSAGKDVKVFGMNGSLIRIIKGPASGFGRLMHPTAVAVDPVQNEVYVSDYGDPADQDPATGTPAGIHVYSSAGTYRRSILGSAAGFSRPQGLAIDDGHLFMADSVLGQVLVFDSGSGLKIATLGSFGSLDGQLFVPLDVVVDPADKNVYVTDSRNSRIAVFEKGGMVP